MTERPILMSKLMIRAILDGRKSMTRRVVKGLDKLAVQHQQYHIGQIRYDTEDYFTRFEKLAGWSAFADTSPYGTLVKCPYGQAGDGLYVKETHYRFGHWVKNGLTKTGRQKWLFKPNDNEVRFMDNPPTVNVHRLSEKTAVGWFKRSSLFLPKSLARLHLEITNIRVERLQDIAPLDAIREGLEGECHFGDNWKERFGILWDSINSKTHPWESNPFVWVIEFRKV